jgi:hypothetical protein
MIAMVLLVGKDLMRCEDRRNDRFGPLRCSGFYSRSSRSSITSRRSALVAWGCQRNIALRCVMPLLNFNVQRVLGVVWYPGPGRVESVVSSPKPAALPLCASDYPIDGSDSEALQPRPHHLTQLEGPSARGQMD